MAAPRDEVEPDQPATDQGGDESTAEAGQGEAAAAQAELPVPSGLSAEPDRPGESSAVPEEERPGAWPDRAALLKEVCRRIREARSRWERHENASARRERSRALALYNILTPEERERVPQVLRVWLRYRSEKYFGRGRRGPGGAHVKPRRKKRPT